MMSSGGKAKKRSYTGLGDRERERVRERSLGLTYRQTAVSKSSIVCCFATVFGWDSRTTSIP